MSSAWRESFLSEDRNPRDGRALSAMPGRLRAAARTQNLSLFALPIFDLCEHSSVHRLEGAAERRGRSLNDVPAVHQQAVAADEAGGAGGEEQHGAGDLLGAADAAGGAAAGEVLLLR